MAKIRAEAGGNAPLPSGASPGVNRALVRTAKDSRTVAKQQSPEYRQRAKRALGASQARGSQLSIAEERHPRLMYGLRSSTCCTLQKMGAKTRAALPRRTLAALRCYPAHVSTVSIRYNKKGQESSGMQILQYSA